MCRQSSVFRCEFWVHDYRHDFSNSNMFCTAQGHHGSGQRSYHSAAQMRKSASPDVARWTSLSSDAAYNYSPYWGRRVLLQGNEQGQSATPPCRTLPAWAAATIAIAPPASVAAGSGCIVWWSDECKVGLELLIHESESVSACLDRCLRLVLFGKLQERISLFVRKASI